jgi:hypothetical protein
MSSGAGGAVAGAAGGAAAGAAIANAVKASGAIIRVEPQEFRKIVDRAETPLIVTATGGLFTKHYKYLTNYKGLFFYTKSAERMQFSSRAEFVNAWKIWMPQ